MSRGLRPVEPEAEVALAVPAAMLDAIAARVAALLADAAPSVPVDPEPWVGLADAAAYLACPKSRVYAEVSRAKDPGCPNPIPYEREGQRLLFRRSDLDAWVRAGGHVERGSR